MLARPYSMAPLWAVAALTAADFGHEALAASGEAQAVVSADAGWSATTEAPAFAGAFDLRIGADDFWWLDLSLGVPAAADPGRVGVEALAGVTFALDVLAWIPWVEALVGVVFDGRADQTARVGLGLDHVLDPEWSVGVVVRSRFAPRRLGGARIMGGLNLSYRWEI